jgi:hypothetical protein
VQGLFTPLFRLDAWKKGKIYRYEELLRLGAGEREREKERKGGRGRGRGRERERERERERRAEGKLNYYPS